MNEKQTELNPFIGYQVGWERQEDERFQAVETA